MSNESSALAVAARVQVTEGYVALATVPALLVQEPECIGSVVRGTETGDGTVIREHISGSRRKSEYDVKVSPFSRRRSEYHRLEVCFEWHFVFFGRRHNDIGGAHLQKWAPKNPQAGAGIPFGSC